MRRKRGLQIVTVLEKNSKDDFAFRFCLPTQQKISIVTREDLGWKINRSRDGVRP